MPRIPKVHRFKRPGRTPYFQIRIGGKLRHLGVDPVKAHRRGAELIAQHFAGGIAGVPDTIAGMVRAWLAENPSQWNGWILQPFIDYVASV